MTHAYKSFFKDFEKSQQNISLSLATYRDRVNVVMQTDLQMLKILCCTISAELYSCRTHSGGVHENFLGAQHVHFPNLQQGKRNLAAIVFVQCLTRRVAEIYCYRFKLLQSE